MWYLILQLFGTNEFELPVIRELSESCAPAAERILVLKRPTSATETNQFNRIKQNSYTSTLFTEAMLFEQDCDFGSQDVIFVNNAGQVLGEYEFNIEDVDRLITEVELYYTIKEQDGTGN